MGIEILPCYSYKDHIWSAELYILGGICDEVNK